jgi:hypothetical protein
MNPIDDQLNRLFRAAGKGEAASPSTAPYGLDTRVVAAWRAAHARDNGSWDMGLLIKGLVAAVVIMGVSFWPVVTSVSTANSPFADFLNLTDSTVPADDAP